LAKQVTFPSAFLPITPDLNAVSATSTKAFEAEKKRRATPPV
jgi:hypothetical protein